MKRDPALVSLSHGHHRALFVALGLRRATAETADEASASFLDYWERHGRTHFRLEEEVLLPAYAAHGTAHHPLVAHALCDHVAIRQLAGGLTDGPAASVETLRELGSELAQHVRFEERELFPLIEAAMPAPALAALADALERAERASPDG